MPAPQKKRRSNFDVLMEDIGGATKYTSLPFWADKVSSGIDSAIKWGQEPFDSEEEEALPTPPAEDAPQEEQDAYRAAMRERFGGKLGETEEEAFGKATPDNLETEVPVAAVAAAAAPKKAAARKLAAAVKSPTEDAVRARSDKLDSMYDGLASPYMGPKKSRVAFHDARQPQNTPLSVQLAHGPRSRPPSIRTMPSLQQAMAPQMEAELTKDGYYGPAAEMAHGASGPAMGTGQNAMSDTGLSGQALASLSAKPFTTPPPEDTRLAELQGAVNMPQPKVDPGLEQASIEAIPERQPTSGEHWRMIEGGEGLPEIAAPNMIAARGGERGAALTALQRMMPADLGGDSKALDAIAALPALRGQRTFAPSGPPEKAPPNAVVGRFKRKKKPQQFASGKE